MLKKISGLFLGFIVCASSACVTPTHASSAQSVIISHIQASGALGAKDEYVVLHNNSGVEVNITNWCVVNKYAVLFACFASAASVVTEQYYLPAYGNAVIASSDHAYVNGHTSEYYSLIYEVTNQSSGSIVNGADTLSLVNEASEVIDSKSWTSSIPTGRMFSRLLIMVGPDIYAATNMNSDWIIENRVLPPQSNLEIRAIHIDPETAPDPEEPKEEPPVQPAGLHPPQITEIFANPAGSDTGNEFIELYNPNEFDAIPLDSFTLQIGVDSAKVYSFPAGSVIQPLGYASFTNQEIDFTLVNTTGRVQLLGNGSVAGEPVDYVSPKDGYSWTRIDEVWQYTRNPTPGAANTYIGLVGAHEETDLEATTVKPCADNQFRNPQTGRCKLISAASSGLATCRAGQERNTETNRCRNIVSSSSTPAPCKEGQERNAETNRCRNIVKMSEAGFEIKGVQSKADTALSWYYWAAIGAVLVLILGYAIWEWRQDLALGWTRLRTSFAKRPD